MREIVNLIFFNLHLTVASSLLTVISNRLLNKVITAPKVIGYALYIRKLNCTRYVKRKTQLCIVLTLGTYYLAYL